MARRGLTLAELVVVLGILAALAAVAIGSLSQVEQQNRFETTRRRLLAVEQAMLGDPGLRDPDGSRIAFGFVGDMGRLPEAEDSDPGTQLCELWDNDKDDDDVDDFPVFALIDAGGANSDVVLGAGWRGPYLELPLGASALLDGPGNVFELDAADGLSAADGDTIVVVRSLGSDGASGGESFELDLAIDLEERWRGDLTVLVEIDSLGVVRAPRSTDMTYGESLYVQLFEPDGAGGLATRTSLLLELDDLGAGAPAGFTFEDVSVGQRAVRAWVDRDANGTFGDPFDLPGRVRYFIQPAGGRTLTVIVDVP